MKVSNQLGSWVASLGSWVRSERKTMELAERAQCQPSGDHLVND